MRPDDQKKKRSAAYKKKHGLDQNKSSASSKSEDRMGQSKPPQFRMGEGTELEDEDQQVRETSAFTKKPIQSNWDRYAPLTDDNEDHGTDYNVLLSFAGDSSSQIKLKQEEEWEEESAALDVLTIDHKHLSCALANIPFCEKYKLAELGVEPDILKYISDISDSEMKQKQISLDAVTSLSASNTSDTGFAFSSFSKGKKSTLAHCKGQEAPMLPAATEKNGGEHSLVLAGVSEILTKDGLQGRTKEASAGTEESQQMPEKEQPNRDDMMVDELLSTKHCTTESHEKATDSAYSLETTTKITEPNEVPVQREDVEVGDLEDWLDSIL